MWQAFAPGNYAALAGRHSAGLSPERRPVARMENRVGKVAVIGMASSAVIGILGYLVGAPVEAVLVLILVGSLAQVLFFGER